MNKIKSYLQSFIWNGKDIQDFESWLYKHDSKDIEEFLGTEAYMNIISHDYRRTNIDSVKKFIKENLSKDLIIEFENYFKLNESMIKGKCIKRDALDYSDNKMRNWDVEFGKTYDLIVIIEQSSNTKNHFSLVNFVDKDEYFTPSGYLPKELFQIDENTLSEHYHQYENEENEIITEPVDWSDKVYKPNDYSFWEDYYNNDSKAVETYFNTLEKLGIKNIW